LGCYFFGLLVAFIMISFVRHLVSQHLGRVVATVALDLSKQGSVRVLPERTPSTEFQFSFSLPTIVQVSGEGRSWVEFAVRLAVAQTHALHRQRCMASDERTKPLRTDLHPWQGDLLFAPFCGATLGALTPDREIKRRVTKRKSGSRRYL
jgi:hypothetical protein